MKNFFAVVLVFALSLAIWREAYSDHALAALALAPLWAFAFLGTYRNIIDKRRSLLLSTLRQSSRLVRLLTGRLLPLLIAIVLSLLSISIFSFSLLLAAPPQVLAAAAIVISSALVYFKLLQVYKRHINDLALSWLAATTTTTVLSLAFLAPYAAMEWAVVQRPGFIRLDFDDAMSQAVQKLPQRGDVINEAFLLFAIIEYAKLWLAARFTGSIVPGALYAVHSALICFAVTNSAVGVASFCYHYLPTAPDRPATKNRGTEDE